MTVRNSETTVAHEYELGSHAMNAAVIEIEGRYPLDGWASNNTTTSLIYVISGQGSAIIDGHEVVLYKDDQLLIEVGEKYAFDGNLHILYVASPAWTADQAEHIPD